KKMSQFLFPGTQHFLIRFVWLHLDWNAVGNLETETLDGGSLDRMVRDQPHLSHSEVVQDLSADTVIARIHLENTRNLQVRLDRIPVPFVSKAIRVKLIHQTKPAPLLSQVEQYTPAFS